MMKQSVRNVCAAVERYGHESDGAVALGDYEPFFGVRKGLAAQRLQDGFELLCLKGGNRLGSSRICVEHLNTIQGKRSSPEVRQMQLVHDIEMRSAWECCGLEWHAHLELWWPGSGLDRRIFVFGSQILRLRMACQLVVRLGNGRT